MPTLTIFYSGQRVREGVNDGKWEKVSSSVAHKLVCQSFKNIRKDVKTNLAYLAVLPKSVPCLLTCSGDFLKNLSQKSKDEDWLLISSSPYKTFHHVWKVERIMLKH